MACALCDQREEVVGGLLGSRSPRVRVIRRIAAVCFEDRVVVELMELRFVGSQCNLSDARARCTSPRRMHRAQTAQETTRKPSLAAPYLCDQPEHVIVRFVGCVPVVTVRAVDPDRGGVRPPGQALHLVHLFCHARASSENESCS